MKAGPECLNFVIDKLSPIGDVRSRAIFGGYGVFFKGSIFDGLFKHSHITFPLLSVPVRLSAANIFITGSDSRHPPSRSD